MKKEDIVRTEKPRIPDPEWDGKKWNYFGREIDHVPASVHNFEAIFGIPPIDGKISKHVEMQDNASLW